MTISGGTLNPNVKQRNPEHAIHENGESWLISTLKTVL